MNEFHAQDETSQKTAPRRHSSHQIIDRPLNQSDHGDALRKRFLNAGDHYYYRNGMGKIAFTDQGKRLTTDHDDPSVIHGMVLRAQEKGWTAFRVNGSQEFQAEAWLQASLAGIQVDGYAPREIDRARFEERKAEQTRENSRNHNGITDMPVAEHSRPGLNPAQQRAVTTLEQLLRDRGDSDAMIAGAVELATSRLQGERLVVGRVAAHGVDHYRHDSTQETSYFVRVTTDRGDKEVWGVDLARAMAQSNLQAGDPIALVQKTHERVTVPVRDEQGQRTGPSSNIADRNVWEVINVQALSREARDRMAAAARVSDRDPIITVYDHAASRTDNRATPARTREQERTRDGR